MAISTGRITPPRNKYIQKMERSPERPVPVHLGETTLYEDLRMRFLAIKGLRVSKEPPTIIERLTALSNSIPVEVSEHEAFLRLTRDISTLISELRKAI